MRVLVDTHILLRSAQPTHPLCSQATHAVAKLLRQRNTVFFCSQNIAEFWNVATRPVDVNGLGFSHEEAMQEIASIESLLTLVPDIPAIYPVWKRLVHSYRVQGVKVYEIQQFQRPRTCIAARLAIEAGKFRAGPPTRPQSRSCFRPYRCATAGSRSTSKCSAFCDSPAISYSF